jgi:hypothetical protein
MLLADHRERCVDDKMSPGARRGGRSAHRATMENRTGRERVLST